MKIPLSIALLAAFSAALLPGCRLKTSFSGDGDTHSVAVAAPADDPAPAVPAPAIPAPMPKSPFEITASSTQKNAEPIELSIEIKNATAQSVELNFTSGQKFDFIATPDGATEAVWSYGMNKRFIQSLSTMSLEAGKSLHFETVWTGAKPGKYTISALVKANGGIQASPFEIVVK